MLEPVVGVLFLMGVILALLRIWDSRGALALILLGVMLQAGIWTIPWEAPQSLRSIGAIPAVVLLASLAIEHLWRLTTSAQIPGGRFVIGLSLVLFLVLGAKNSYQAYFVEGPKNQYVWAGHSTAEAYIGKLLREIEPTQDVITLGTAKMRNHATIKFVSGGRSIRQQYRNVESHFPLNVVPHKLIIVFTKKKKEADWIRSIYPTSRMTPYRGPVSRFPTLYTTYISPEDVNAAHGLRDDGKGRFWLKKSWATEDINRRIKFSLVGPGRLRIDGKLVLEGPGDSWVKLLPGPHPIQLRGGKNQDLSADYGIFTK